MEAEKITDSNHHFTFSLLQPAFGLEEPLNCCNACKVLVVCVSVCFVNFSVVTSKFEEIILT